MRKIIFLMVVVLSLFTIIACSGYYGMVVIVFNISYFLIFIKDMGRRGERKLVWFITFLFLGPVAVTWYKSYRKQKDAEVVKGNKLYRLAKHFFLPWSIYALLLPIFWVQYFLLIWFPIFPSAPL